MQVAQRRKIVRQHRADVHQTAVGAHGIDTATLPDRHPSTIPHRARARRQNGVSIPSPHPGSARVPLRANPPARINFPRRD